MRGDPAVEAAAVAALCGFDPLGYAHAEGVDRLFVDAALQRAAALRSEEMTQLAEAIGTYAGNAVADVIGRMFKS